MGQISTVGVRRPLAGRRLATCSSVPCITVTGTALTEIDQVTRRLAELIERISDTAQKEANHANGVANNIQHILEVTADAEAGTRNTAKQVRDLTRIADELRQSVSRFKI